MPATGVHRGTLAATLENHSVRRLTTHPGRPIRPGHRYAVHLGRPALRTADGHDRDERRASWLELFFDLAFAGAVGQLAGAFQSHPGLGALAARATHSKIATRIEIRCAASSVSCRSA